MIKFTLLPGDVIRCLTFVQAQATREMGMRIFPLNFDDQEWQAYGCPRVFEKTLTVIEINTVRWSFKSAELGWVHCLPGDDFEVLGP